jgi:hypothetical protein
VSVDIDFNSRLAYRAKALSYGTVVAIRAKPSDKDSLSAFEVRWASLRDPVQEAKILAADGNALRWLRKQPGLGIVDGDDGGALRAVLAVECLRCRSFCAPEILL